jgi:hypothetical protein
MGSRLIAVRRGGLSAAVAVTLPLANAMTNAFHGTRNALNYLRRSNLQAVDVAKEFAVPVTRRSSYFDP